MSFFLIKNTSDVKVTYNGFVIAPYSILMGGDQSFTAAHYPFVSDKKYIWNVKKEQWGQIWSSEPRVILPKIEIISKSLVDPVRYPHKCTRCNAPAYIGLNLVDCSDIQCH